MEDDVPLHLSLPPSHRFYFSFSPNFKKLIALVSLFILF